MFVPGRLTIIREAIPVKIDIRPGSSVNPVTSMGRGIAPVAILGSETFDVMEVNEATLELGPGNAATDPFGWLRDVNGDGLTDLVAHFSTQNIIVVFGGGEACITGELLDGTPFRGCDSIRTVPRAGAPIRAALGAHRR